MSDDYAKAYLEVETGDEIKCMYNPDSLSFSKSNKFEADNVPGKETPTLNYAGGSSGVMKLSLLFDSTKIGEPVTKDTNKVLDLLKVDPSLPGHNDGSNTGRPPWVKFHWADLHSWKAVVESVSVTFTYFAQNGMPMRARTDLGLKQYEPDAEWGPQNPTSGTPKPHRTHQVQAGETLDRIAAHYLGNPTQWRRLAAANGLTDPLAIRPGQIIAIPKVTD